MNEAFLKFYIIGDPIDQSLSPMMHNFFLDKFKLKGKYAAKQVKVDKLGQVIKTFINEGVNGINVTSPHKKTVLKYIDELTSEAESIGSVNTIKFENGKLIGHNTDAIGFQTSLRVLGHRFENKNAIIFGAGGAARAVVVALIREQCKKIVISNRSLDKAKALVDDLSYRYTGIELIAVSQEFTEINSVIKSSQLLINATTIGMGDLINASILSNTDCLHKDLLVYDLIYRPYQTELLYQAESCNIPWINGMDMLIFQGIESLKFWTKRDLIIDDSIYSMIKSILRREVCQE
ncbi:MAG: shikimate dehydrogenase [bacterium]|nr:MAG: shikimate dehydrogenase [bacterium]